MEVWITKLIETSVLGAVLLYIIWAISSKLSTRLHQSIETTYKIATLLETNTRLLIEVSKVFTGLRELRLLMMRLQTDKKLIEHQAEILEILRELQKNVNEAEETKQQIHKMLGDLDDTR